MNHFINIGRLIFGFDLNDLKDAREDKNKKKAIKDKLNILEQKTIKDFEPNFGEFLLNTQRIFSYLTRAYSIQLRELQNIDAFPVFSISIPEDTEKINKSDVIQITIKSLPVPDNRTSWEQILEFRSDSDSYSKFLALRNWMNEVSKGELSSIEIEQKLEYLIDQYQQHMKLHKMKTNAGTLQTFITTSAEVLGDLASFKWGKAAETLFALKNRKVALLEGELKSPGNEVAYIIKAQESFS